MDRIAGSWKMLVGMVAAGAVLFYASVRVEAANNLPPAQDGSFAAPAADPSGPPTSNEIQDFPQLD